MNRRQLFAFMGAAAVAPADLLRRPAPAPVDPMAETWAENEWTVDPGPYLPIKMTRYYVFDITPMVG